MFEQTPETTQAKELSDYDYDAFKKLVIGLHNELVGGPQLGGFDADKNFIGQQHALGGGELEGIPVRYPRASDKDELMQYALEKAQSCEDPSYGAMLLSAGVVAVHPFLDGNGRVSRAVYSDFMGVQRVDESGRRSDVDMNQQARDAIDMGSAFSHDLLKSWQRRYPYVAMNLSDERIRVGLYNTRYSEEKDQAVLRDDALEGLDAAERDDLISAIGADRYGNTYNNDVEGLMFATKNIVHQYPDLKELITDQNDFSFINIHDFLPQLSVGQKKEFVESLWLHRKLLAQGAIDFLADDFGGKEVVTLQERPAQKMRDFVIERTTNLHSSRLR